MALQPTPQQIHHLRHSDVFSLKFCRFLVAPQAGSPRVIYYDSLC